jgi:mRNA interferase MazF
MVTKEVCQGDVYWLDFGAAPAERHPCVVVQSDVFNRTRILTTVVCLITSNLNRATAPGNVPLKKGDARLPKPSVVNVSQVVTVDKLDLEERIGSLPSAALSSVLQGLRILFEGGSKGQDLTATTFTSLALVTPPQL